MPSGRWNVAQVGLNSTTNMDVESTVHDWVERIVEERLHAQQLEVTAEILRELTPHVGGSTPPRCVASVCNVINAENRSTRYDLNTAK